MASNLPVDMHADGGCPENGWEKAWSGGMENACDQKESGRKRWMKGRGSEKNSLSTLGFRFSRGQEGKKFPKSDCGSGCHFIDQWLVFTEPNHGRIENMQKIMAGLLLIGCCGCSTGMYTDLVEVEMRLASPRFGEAKRIPVVYPGRSEVSDDSIEQAFGPSWRSLENYYPAYNFNP